MPFNIEFNEGDKNMTAGNRWMICGFVLVVGALCTFLASTSRAQVQTKTTTKTGQSSEAVRVEQGEVIAVEGTDLIVKMEDGAVRHFENIPESTKIFVDGKELGIRDLKPGMRLQRTIVTTTTPKVVTTVQTVQGKVWYVNPPLLVTLTLEDGTNQSFKIPKDQKFNVNGQMVDSFALKKGMQVTVTKIVEVPMSATTRQKTLSGTMPTAETPLLVAEGEPTAAPQEATEAPSTTPDRGPARGSIILWIGFVVLLLIIVWIASRFRRAKKRA